LSIIEIWHFLFPLILEGFLKNEFCNLRAIEKCEYTGVNDYLGILGIHISSRILNIRLHIFGYVIRWSMATNENLNIFKDRFEY
jgi:hypothetical protein